MGTALDTTYRAAFYVRLSREDEQEGPSQSIANQISLLTAYADEHSLTVVDTYVDDGFSGTTFDRPGFQRMLQDIEAGRVNLVLTKDLSRLGRDYIQTGHYLERYFPEKGVRYISLLDGVDTAVENSANDMTPFRAILNDMYAKDISRKIRSVKHDQQRRGLFIGGKPIYGYKLSDQEKNKIEPDPQAASVVQDMFRLAREGISCRQIAEQFNRQGIPSPAVYAGLNQGKTGKWSGERISEMLRSEAYLGNMVQGRCRKLSYKSKKCIRQDPENWVVVADTHEPLVDRETFDQVNRLLAGRRHTRLRTYDYPLRGLIFCHECGHPLGVLNRKTAGGEDRLYFVCRTYQHNIRDGRCSGHFVREEIVTQTVRNVLHNLCAPWLTEAFCLPTARETCARISESGTAQKAEDTCRLLTGKIDRLYQDRLSGILAEEDFTRLYRRLTEERSSWEHRRQPTTATPLSPEELTSRFLHAAQDSRLLFTTFLDRIELTEDRQVLITLRCAPPKALPYARSDT